MKKLTYLPVYLLITLAVACSTRNRNVKETSNKSGQPVANKELSGVMRIQGAIKTGDSVLLNFTVYNHTDGVKKFLKWQTPFEPLLSKYLDIKNEQGEEVLYKGPMVKRMMPPPPSAYITLNPQDSLAVKVDILKGYALTKPGKYTVEYTSENISGLTVKQQVSFIYR
ncbi:protease [Mucilaginibacter sp. BJC16-A38]|uniref:protease n=1 Tax=Mucilaginibacter phenanthrenivorans TaxID=1234842 RepID=UPI002156FAF2|nr:protease [Mucilaginibacter phenanthrenivorans]MCR8557357.1 protease [Mucilaginibacter phenanthrenivorans]